MKIEPQVRCALMLAAASCIVATGATPALASEPEKAASEGQSGAEVERASGEGEHEETDEVSLDLVLGWGKVPFAAQDPATAAAPTAAYSLARNTPVDVQSFVAGTDFEVAEHVGVGVRVPFTLATFSPNGAPSRSTTGFGNVELEGEYGGPIAPGLRLAGSLGVALPTATGDEIPDDLRHQPAGSFDQSAYDRFSLARAAASARGYEDNALFEPQRLGLVPKLSALYRTHGLSIEPYVKLENLVATSSALATEYVGEFVGAVRVGYWVHKEFELAVRGWVNVGYAGSDEDKQASAAVEPQVVLRFGPVRPYGGVIIPLAGPPNDADFLGLRVGVAAAF